MAVGRSSTRVTKALALESFSWNVSSSAVYAGFAGVTIPDAHSVPQVMEGVSIWLVLVQVNTVVFEVRGLDGPKDG